MQFERTTPTGSRSSSPAAAPFARGWGSPPTDVIFRCQNERVTANFRLAFCLPAQATLEDEFPRANLAITIPIPT